MKSFSTLHQGLFPKFALSLESLMVVLRLCLSRSSRSHVLIVASSPGEHGRVTGQLAL